MALRTSGSSFRSENFVMNVHQVAVSDRKGEGTLRSGAPC